MNGIDISRHQGDDFSVQRAKDEHNIDFVIIKIGGADDGLYKDSQAENFYNQACRAIVDKGFYFYGNAATPEEAIKEADFCISLLAGKKFEYPIFYDVESKRMTNVVWDSRNKKYRPGGRRKITDIAKAFCERMENSGFWAGIYSSTSFYEDFFYDEELVPYSHWVADWRGSKPALSSGAETQIWQTGSTKRWQGSKTVDNDICYVTYYEDAVKKKGLNGYGPQKDIKQIAREVWAGYWGNGEYRKKVLTKMGYDYRAVQDEVNRLKKGAKK